MLCAYCKLIRVLFFIRINQHFYYNYCSLKLSFSNTSFCICGVCKKYCAYDQELKYPHVVHWAYLKLYAYLCSVFSYISLTKIRIIASLWIHWNKISCISYTGDTYTHYYYTGDTYTHYYYTGDNYKDWWFWPNSMRWILCAQNVIECLNCERLPISVIVN